MTQTPGFYTISEAAGKLNVTRLTVYHWIEQGRLQPTRSTTRWLIPIAQIDEFQKPCQ